MKISQNDVASSSDTPFFEIGSDLENIQVELERVRNVLYVFDQHLEEEIDFMSESDDGYIKRFIKRYEMLSSMMELIKIHLDSAIDSMRPQINAVYEYGSHLRHIEEPRSGSGEDDCKNDT